MTLYNVKDIKVKENNFISANKVNRIKVHNGLILSSDFHTIMKSHRIKDNIVYYFFNSQT